MPEYYTFEVMQDGLAVASATAADRDAALREIMHYAAQYAQDGEVLVRETIKRGRHKRS